MKEEQKTRVGTFSASQIYRLFGSGRRTMTKKELEEEKARGGKRKTIDTYFGSKAMSYITEVATERFTGHPAKLDFTSKYTDWGNEHEEEAKEYFKVATGGIVENVTRVYFFEEMLSGIADGILKEDNKDFGFEIKCPANSVNHFEYLTIETQEDLREKRPEYFWQIYTYAFLYKLKYFKFCSYDPRFKEEKRMFILNIDIKKEYMKELTERIVMAIEEMKKITAKLL